MGWVVNATPRPLYLPERTGIHFIGGWLGPRAGLDRCGISRPHRDSIPGPSSSYRVSIPTMLFRPVEGMGHSIISKDPTGIRSRNLLSCGAMTQPTARLIANKKRSTIGSRFATVRFMMIHFYDACRVGPSTPDLWCITVATQASFLCLLRL